MQTNSIIDVIIATIDRILQLTVGLVLASMLALIGYILLLSAAIS